MGHAFMDCRAATTRHLQRLQVQHEEQHSESHPKVKEASFSGQFVYVHLDPAEGCCDAEKKVARWAAVRVEDSTPSACWKEGELIEPVEGVHVLIHLAVFNGTELGSRFKVSLRRARKLLSSLREAVALAMVVVATSPSTMIPPLGFTLGTAAISSNNLSLASCAAINSSNALSSVTRTASLYARLLRVPALW